MAQQPIRGIATAGRGVAQSILAKEKLKREDEKAARELELKKKKAALDSELLMQDIEARNPDVADYLRENKVFERYAELGEIPDQKVIDRLFESFQLEHDNDLAAIDELTAGISAETGADEDLLGSPEFQSILAGAEGIGNAPLPGLSQMIAGITARGDFDVRSGLRGFAKQEAMTAATNKGEAMSAELAAKNASKPPPKTPEDIGRDRARAIIARNNALAAAGEHVPGRKEDGSYTDAQLRSMTNEVASQTRADLLADADAIYQTITTADERADIGVSFITSEDDLKRAIKNIGDDDVRGAIELYPEHIYKTRTSEWRDSVKASFSGGSTGNADSGLTPEEEEELRQLEAEFSNQ